MYGRPGRPGMRPGYGPGIGPGYCGIPPHHRQFGGFAPHHHPMPGAYPPGPGYRY